MPGNERTRRTGIDSTWPATASDVTCVITSHGRPDFIPDAIRSVFDQTEAVAEIVVVSDIEAPETESIVREFGTSGRVPVRWIDRSDEGSPGVSRSRNRGIAEAHTPWVAVLDDDDEWSPTFVAEMCAAVNRSRSLVALCSKVRFGQPESEGVVIPARPGLDPSEMMRADTFAHGGYIMANVALAERFPYDESFQGAEDWDLFIRLGNAGIGYEVVERPLLRSRLHGGGRVSQSGLHVASMYRRLADKHRDSLDLRARRGLVFEALWIERRALDGRVAREWARIKLLAYAPYDRLFTDHDYRRQLTSRVRSRLTSLTGRDGRHT